MEKFVTDGIVVKTKVTGESDLIVFVLTRRKGVIRAFAKGARNMKSKLHGGTALFAYSEFSFYEKNGAYNITEVQPKSVFFELIGDMPRLTLAQYLCEIVLRTLTEPIEDETYFRLLLASLYYLNSGKKNVLLIKAVFELRFAAVSGYAPAVHACSVCGAFSDERMRFNCLSGELSCASCSSEEEAPSVPMSVITAMRHIVYSPEDKIFSFLLNEENLYQLTRLTETYLQNCFQLRFRVTEYFWLAMRS